MKIKFHHVLAFFILTLFFDFDYDVGGVRLRIIDVLLIGIAAMMILSGGKLKISNNPATISIYLLITYFLINGILKVSIGSIAKEIIQIFEYLFIMYLIADSTNEPRKRKEFLDVLFWGTGCIAFYSMMYNIAGGRFANYKDLDSPKHSFAFFALLALTRLLSSSRKTLFELGTVFLGLVMLLLSGERKGWAGFFIGSVFFVYLQIKSSYSKRNIGGIINFFTTIGTAATILIIIFISLPQFAYLSRQLTSLSDIGNIFSDDNNKYASLSDQERIFMFNFGIQTFLKNPVSGIGIDQFKDYIMRATHGAISHDAHNFYLKILVENGIIGLALFLVPLVLIFAELWKLSKNKIPHISLQARTTLALFFLGSVVNFFLAGKALSWLYVILPCGLILGMNKELRFYKNIKPLQRGKRQVPASIN